MIRLRGNSGAATVSDHTCLPPMIEALEPRLLLSAECLPGLEGVEGLLGHTAGQVVYLDFDGQEDVDYNGPFHVADIDVPAFSAPELAEAVTAHVAEMLSSLGVQVVRDAPAAGEYSTIYIGGTGAAFAAHGAIDGLAEGVDVGNADRNDIAFVFSDDLAAAAASAAEYARSVAAVAAHEAGHLLGLAHSEDGPLGRVMAAGGGQAAGALAEVAHEQPVHMWIAAEAAKLYDMHYAGSELDPNDGYVAAVVQGAYDQDTAKQPDGYVPTLSVTERHFVEGADGNELHDGLHAYTSAYDLACKLLTQYALPWYNAGYKAQGYYFFGHVAHLLADMTVPAHVHNDIHPSYDSYEEEIYEWSDYGGNPAPFIWYQYFEGTDVDGPIRCYGNFETLFRETTDYTDDYDSDDYNGDANEGDPIFPPARLAELGLTWRHLPGAAVNNNDNDYYGSVWYESLPPIALYVLARDLMPWAFEQTAALFRLFYQITDQTAPVVAPVTLPATNLTGLNGVPRYDWDIFVTGSAQDDESGVGRQSYRYYVQRYDFLQDDWGDWQLASVEQGEETQIIVADGYYRIALQVTNGADEQNLLAEAPEVIFQVGALAPDQIVLTVTPGEIDENDSTLLAGTFNAAADLPCTVDIDWGDGSPHTTLNRAAGVFSFSAEHQYLDDDPSDSPQDVFTINVTVTNASGSAAESTDVTVNNVAPEIANLSVTSPIDENGAATLSGELIDPGTLDTFTMTVDWGDGSGLETFTYPAGTTVFSETHPYLDDNPTGTPQDDYIITVTLTDDDTGIDTDAATVTVLNVDPVIQTLATSAAGVGDAGENDEVTLTGTFTDVGTLDTHTAGVDWGDGIITSAVIDEAGGSGTFTAAHAYEFGGIYTVTVTLADDDTGTDAAAVMAVITGAGINDGVLQIVGTGARDRVKLSLQGNARVKVHASFLADRGRQRNFNAEDVERIEILLGDGNDFAQISGNIKLPAILDAGAGRDFIKAGGGPSVLLGQEGRDTLIGGHDNDVLIGGEGRDRLVGGPGEDILIGGTTAFDVNDDQLPLAWNEPLLAILAEWSSQRAFDARVANLSGTGTGDRLNGNYFLLPDVTVFDDLARDWLTGAAGKDWEIS